MNGGHSVFGYSNKHLLILRETLETKDRRFRRKSLHSDYILYKCLIHLKTRKTNRFYAGKCFLCAERCELIMPRTEDDVQTKPKYFGCRSFFRMAKLLTDEIPKLWKKISIYLYKLCAKSRMRAWFRNGNREKGEERWQKNKETIPLPKRMDWFFQIKFKKCLLNPFYRVLLLAVKKSDILSLQMELGFCWVVCSAALYCIIREHRQILFVCFTLECVPWQKLFAQANQIWCHLNQAIA